MRGVWAGLHHALAALRTEHPAVVVQLRQAAVAAIRQALRAGTADMAVVAFDRRQQPGPATRLLTSEDMVLPASPRPIIAGATPNDEVEFTEVARLPLVDFTPGWAIRYAVDRAFRAAGVDRSTTFEVNDIVAAAEALAGDRSQKWRAASFASSARSSAIRSTVSARTAQGRAGAGADVVCGRPRPRPVRCAVGPR
jgi:hypothetical protein